VDAAERLADYLAGELDADEHATVEAALARDPALRTQLEHLQRADGALAGLISPAPPEGFEDRLQAALAPALAEELGLVAEAAAVPASAGERIAADELAAARARREARSGATRGRRWLPVVGGVAASLLLLAVAVSVVGPLGGDDSFEVASGGLDADEVDGAEEPAEGASGDDADDDPTVERHGADPGSEEEVVEDAVEEAAGAPADAEDVWSGPQVVLSGRTLDAAAVSGLLDAGATSALVASGLDATTGNEVAGRWTAQLGVTTGAEQDVTSDSAEDGASGDREAATVDPLADLQPADRQAVGRCLAEVLETERERPGPAIPTYVELLTTADVPAIVFVLLAAGDDGRFTVPEAWLVARDDCRVLGTTER
jgi:hypothetical protein